MLLNMLHCTAQPPTAKHYLALSVNSAENGNPGVGYNLPELSLGWGVVVGQITTGLVGHKNMSGKNWRYWCEVKG